jgi:RNA polymerase sigma factor (sigma-70 family)
VSDPIGRRRATGINVSADQDLGLLRAVAGGDERALRTLFERHAPWLAARLRRRCNDDEVVVDVLSDTFVAVWRGAHRFRGEGDVAAWLWGIAAKRLVSRLRGRPAPERWPADALDARFEPLVSAEEQVLLGVEHGDLGRALTELSPELRAVVQATSSTASPRATRRGCSGFPRGR